MSEWRRYSSAEEKKEARESHGQITRAGRSLMCRHTFQYIYGDNDHPPYNKVPNTKDNLRQELDERRIAVIGQTVAHTPLGTLAIASLIADYAPGHHFFLPDYSSRSDASKRRWVRIETSRAAKRTKKESRHQGIIGLIEAHIDMYSIAAIIADYEPGPDRGYDIPVTFEGESVLAKALYPFSIYSHIPLAMLNRRIAVWEKEIGDEYPLYVYRISGIGIEFGLNRVMPRACLNEVHDHGRHSPDGLIITSSFISKLMI